MNEPIQKYFSTIRVGNREFEITYIKSLIYIKQNIERTNYERINQLSPIHH